MDVLIYIVGLVIAVVALFAWMDGADKGKW